MNNVADKDVGYDFSFGVWQFEGEACIPNGIKTTSVMQVFGSSSFSLLLFFSNVKIYIDGIQRYEESDDEKTNHYFKFRAYMELGASHYMESH
ncbi:citrate-binding protein-like [Gossypium arboreum]|uniref:citrate-binding protein-like n=1 Tax=Gossypium arboreum TaxID=29729 RepID=UPI0022F1DCF8|nr:citrate-binding protein-like [Gossypium arboreum]